MPRNPHVAYADAEFGSVAYQSMTKGMAGSGCSSPILIWQSLTLPNRSRAVEHVSPLRRELESAQRILHAVVSWLGGVERGEAWIHRRGIGPESAGVAPLREYE